MKKSLIRVVVASAVFVAVAIVAMSALTVPTQANQSCEQQCYQDYRRCVPICAKNPCFVSCETVLEICLSNCGQPA